MNRSERERLAEAVFIVHGAVMNGGFLSAFEVAGPIIAEAARGYDRIGLRDVAGLIRVAILEFPGGLIPTDPSEREDLVGEVLGTEVLERMDSTYDQLVPNDQVLEVKLRQFVSMR